MDSYEKAVDTMIPFFASSGMLKYIPPEDRREAMGKVIQYINNDEFEYQDNFRMTDIKNKDRYDAIANNGCCGSVDISFKVKSGNVILFGFNYGH